MDTLAESIIDITRITDEFVSVNSVEVLKVHQWNNESIGEYLKEFIYNAAMEFQHVRGINEIDFVYTEEIKEFTLTKLRGKYLR